MDMNTFLSKMCNFYFSTPYNHYGIKYCTTTAHPNKHFQLFQGVVVTEDAKVHPAVIGAGLVGHGAVVAARVGQLNAPDTQRPFS